MQSSLFDLRIYSADEITTGDDPPVGTGDWLIEFHDQISMIVNTDGSIQCAW